MKRLSGSTRSTWIQCCTVAATSLCRNLMAPIPMATRRRALNSLNKPIRIRTEDKFEDLADRCLLAGLVLLVWRATFLWYLLFLGGAGAVVIFSEHESRHHDRAGQTLRPAMYRRPAHHGMGCVPLARGRDDGTANS